MKESNEAKESKEAKEFKARMRRAKLPYLLMLAVFLTAQSLTLAADICFHWITLREALLLNFLNLFIFVVWPSQRMRIKQLETSLSEVEKCYVEVCKWL